MDDTKDKVPGRVRFKVGIATSDGIVVNMHFGRAESFSIYEVYDDETSALVEKRSIPPACEGGEHDDKRLLENAQIFKDCKYLLVSRIGPGAERVLSQLGITALEHPGLIDESIQKLIAYEKLQKLF